MLHEIKTAAVLAKAVAKNARACPAQQALQMATLNGARALNLQDKIGSLEPGKMADIIAIRLDDIETQPLWNPVSHVVYAASREW